MQKLLHHYTANIEVDYIEKVTGMVTNEPVAVVQDHDSSNRMTTKQFLITWILIGHQKTAV